jgi:3-oxoacyl-[acyl-carrier-protein] synthase-3
MRIKERPICNKSGARFAKSNVDPLEIDMIIMATATPDMPVASTGGFCYCNWRNKCFAYDLLRALAFVYGMSAARTSIRKVKKVLLIGNVFYC